MGRVSNRDRDTHAIAGIMTLNWVPKASVRRAATMAV